MELDRTYALIHLDNILHNYQLVKSQVKTSEVLAVVKADAYGHGSVEVARHLESNGCKYFAVASLSEAIELREADILGEILIFGRTTPSNFKYLIKYDLIQTVYSLEYAKLINKEESKIRVHINIDSGMSRFGLYLHTKADMDQVFDEVKQISEMDNIVLEGVYTHFANSDEVESGFCEIQFSLFKLLLDKLDRTGIKPLLKHASNSAASLAFANTYLDMVRLGIAMYGYPPVNTDLNFKPVMEIFSRVTSIRKIKKEDTVSYGRTYKSDADQKIATIAIGYADGYNRLLSNKDYLVFKDKKLPVIGRVCMDAIMVSIDDFEINDGDYVEIFGLKKDMNSMCKTLNTIPYEILCNVSKRVKRIYSQ